MTQLSIQPPTTKALNQPTLAQTLSRYYFSMRHLKTVQVWGRMRRVAQRKVLHRSGAYKTRYVRRATGREAFRALVLPAGVHSFSHVAQQHSLDDISHNTFTFLNRRICLGEPIDWLPRHETQLWHYNLHYFDYTAALVQAYAKTRDDGYYREFQRLVRSWIARCPIATPGAWDSYPISLRVTNWIKAYTFFEPALRADHAFAAELRHSIYVQVAFLEDHLEYHLLGNHLVENGRALLFAGLFFHDDQGRRWRKLGERILWRELREEFLADGGHFERSPMYHQIMLHLYRDVVTVLEGQKQPIPAIADERIPTMERWLRSILHPDGQIPLLNDAAMGVAGEPAHLLGNAVPPSDGLTALPESGYFVFRKTPPQYRHPLNTIELLTSNHAPITNGGDGAVKLSSRSDYLVFDCGPLGPDYFPSHGHCDALSYELSLQGQRFIVDTGVDNYYGDLEWRLYNRSTRAHNTVVVDDAEQSEIWDRFRVARRAHPADVRWAEEGERLAYVIGSHTGYRRLAGSVDHRRWLVWIDRRFWLVCDRIVGTGPHRVESFIHLDPDVRIVTAPAVNPLDRNSQGIPGIVKRGDACLQVIPWGVRTVSTHRGEMNPIQGWVLPEFGLQIENTVWSLQQEEVLPIWLGYMLWPEESAVSLAAVDNGDVCTVNIHADDGHYQISCHPNHVHLEIVT